MISCYSTVKRWANYVCYNMKHLASTQHVMHHWRQYNLKKDRWWGGLAKTDLLYRNLGRSAKDLSADSSCLLADSACLQASEISLQVESASRQEQAGRNCLQADFQPWWWALLARSILPVLFLFTKINLRKFLL